MLAAGRQVVALPPAFEDGNMASSPPPATFDWVALAMVLGWAAMGFGAVVYLAGY